MNSQFIAEYYRNISFDERSLIAVKVLKSESRDLTEKEALKDIPKDTYICLIKMRNPVGKYCTTRTIFYSQIRNRLNSIEREKRLKRKKKCGK
jgi:hypothetical protein